MKERYRWISIVALIPFVLLAPALSGGCRAKPKVICVMENPGTGQRVEMYKESWFKVPADYDERQHIEQWKAEQRKMGFTVEVKQ